MDTEAWQVLEELKGLLDKRSIRDSYPPYMTFRQAEQFLGLKGSAKHIALKRFLHEENVPVKLFNGKGKRVSRKRLEIVMERNLQYVAK